MTAQALVSAIDGMTNESSGDELFSELETQEYREAFELFDKVGRAMSKSQLQYTFLAMFTKVVLEWSSALVIAAFPVKTIAQCTLVTFEVH